MPERIGFIGLGIMGKPMALRLLQAGHPLAVHSRSRPPIDELIQAGATDGESPRGVAEQSDVMITMLPDSPDVRQVVLGLNGVIEGTRPGQIFIDMSTISPLVSRDEIAPALESRQAFALDAPVSGGQRGAIDGTLSIMVGGPLAAHERVLPILQALGKNIVHVGGPGAGQIAKACNQIIVGATIMAVAEALTLARKADVDVAKVREALLGGFASSRILEVHGQRMLDRTFEPGFRIALHHKDLGIALAAGGAFAAPLVETGLVREALGAMLARGEGSLDHSAPVRLVEALAGLSVSEDLPESR
jgi:2-hydroxy-3-oxopropionate reductase